MRRNFRAEREYTPMVDYKRPIRGLERKLRMILKSLSDASEMIGEIKNNEVTGQEVKSIKKAWGKVDEAIDILINFEDAYIDDWEN